MLCGSFCSVDAKLSRLRQGSPTQYGKRQSSWEHGRLRDKRSCSSQRATPSTIASARPRRPLAGHCQREMNSRAVAAAATTSGATGARLARRGPAPGQDRRAPIPADARATDTMFTRTDGTNTPPSKRTKSASIRPSQRCRVDLIEAFVRSSLVGWYSPDVRRERCVSLDVYRDGVQCRRWPAWAPSSCRPSSSWTGGLAVDKKPPPQFGHTFARTSSTHRVQNVHSKLQMRAFSDSGGKGSLQFSHDGRS